MQRLSSTCISSRCLSSPRLTSFSKISSRWQSSFKSVQDYINSSEAFPWNFPESPKRPIPWPPGKSLELVDNRSLFQRIAHPFFSAGQRAFVENMLKASFGEVYMSTSLILGTTLALQSLAEAISGKEPDRTMLKRICEPRLYNRLDKELQKLQDRGEHIQVSLGKFYDTEVDEILYVFGPSIANKDVQFRDLHKAKILLNIGRDQVMIRRGTLGFVISRKDMEQVQNNRELMQKVSLSGAWVVVDMRVDVDVDFTHYKGDDVLFTTSLRYQNPGLTLSLTSDSFETEPQDGGLQVPDWKISDIDHLLESDMFMKWVDEE